jgi:GTP cyclohydrolase I
MCYLANENIELDSIHKDKITNNVINALQELMKALLIDTDSDHNTKDTTQRIAKMYVNELFKGRYEPKPDLTSFPNHKNVDQLYTVSGISVRSTCSHHFAPIIGEAFIGIIPGERIIGLSKFSRLVDWIASRPQIQEEMTVQIADIIEEEIKPIGLAVVVKAKHYCMIWRGVKENESVMTSSIMRGALRNNAEARAEFLELIK